MADKSRSERDEKSNYPSGYRDDATGVLKQKQGDNTANTQQYCLLLCSLRSNQSHPESELTLFVRLDSPEKPSLSMVGCSFRLHTITNTL